MTVTGEQSGDQQADMNVLASRAREIVAELLAGKPVEKDAMLAFQSAPPDLIERYLRAATPVAQAAARGGRSRDAAFAELDEQREAMIQEIFRSAGAEMSDDEKDAVRLAFNSMVREEVS